MVYFTDDIDAIMDKDEQYEMIDECVGEEIPETVENTETEVMVRPDKTTQQKSSETSIGMMY